MYGATASYFENIEHFVFETSLTFFSLLKNEERMFDDSIAKSYLVY